MIVVVIVIGGPTADDVSPSHLHTVSPSPPLNVPVSLLVACSLSASTPQKAKALLCTCPSVGAPKARAMDSNSRLLKEVCLWADAGVGVSVLLRRDHAVNPLCAAQGNSERQALRRHRGAGGR